MVSLFAFGASEFRVAMLGTMEFLEADRTESILLRDLFSFR